MKYAASAMPPVEPPDGAAPLPLQQPAAALTRRRFLQLGAATLAGAAAGYGYTSALEPRWVEIEQVALPVQGLPPHLAGRRIVQISDIHLSTYTSPARVYDAIEQVNVLAPDWIVLTGDYVGGEAAAAAGLVEALQAADSPVYAVLGNHDHWTDPAVVSGFLGDAGAELLVNRGVGLESGLWLAGVDDVWSGRPDLRAALAAVPAGAATILLAHEPDYFDHVVESDAPVAVQLSGHSHGGQVRLPTFGPGPDGIYSRALQLPRLGRRYPIGLRRVGGRAIYTNRGLGVWPLPYRLNCRPEITLFTLAAA